MSRTLKEIGAKALRTLMAVLMAVGLVPLPAYAADLQAGGSSLGGQSVSAESVTAAAANIASGTSGTCTWVIDGNGKLTVRPTSGSVGTLGTWSAHPDWYAHRAAITSAAFEGTVKARTCAYMFTGLTSLASIDLSGLDTSSVADMSGMFSNCTSLSSLDLSSLDTSNVTNMNTMFYNCPFSTLDASSLDTSSVSSMYGMFQSCSSLASLDLAGFETSGVADMEQMFSGCDSLAMLRVGNGWLRAAVSEPAKRPTFPVRMANSSTKVWFESGAEMPTGAATYVAALPAGLAFPALLTMRALADGAFPSGLTKETTAAVSYSSSNPQVATVDSTGEVTPIARDTTVITAQAPVADGYEAGSATFTLIVECTSMSTALIADIPDQTYTGSALEPCPVVTLGGRELAAGTDYTLSYADNEDAGTATVTLLGIGSYYGSKTVEFTIARAVPALAFESASVSKKTVDEPFANPLAKTTDGVVAFASSDESVVTVDAESGLVTIEGAGTTTITATADEGANYQAGSASYTLAVERTSISGAQVTLAASSCVYSGSPILPSVEKVMLGARELRPADYTVRYSNNVNAGTASVVVAGIGAYAGSVTKTFTVKPASLSSLSLKASSATYDNKSHKPVVKAVKAGSLTATYKVTYWRGSKQTTDFKTGGAITVKVSGTGNFTGTKSATFKINPKANPMSVKAVAKKVSLPKGKKALAKAATVSGAVSFAKKAQGKVTYSKVAKGSAKCLSVAKSTGKVTVAKGTKAGAYKICIAVKAAGNANYKAATKQVTVKVTVK